MSEAAIEVDRLKGNIISRFAATENMITEYIVKQYITNKEDQLKILQDVFEHKYFSFDMKKSIFYKILKENDKTKYNKFPKTKFERMQYIRNVLAHGTTTVEDMKDSNNIEKLNINHSGVKYSAKGIINEYNELYQVVNPIVVDITNTRMVSE